MNNARFQSILKNLTNVARKVFDAIPISEAWTTQQVRSELIRSGVAVTREYSVIEGCINNLVSSGIVIENPRGYFKRVAVNEPDNQKRQIVPKPIQQPKTVSEPEQMSTEEKKPFSVLDRLAGLANRASTLAISMKALASEIETAAIEAEQEMEKHAEGRKKLEQLQSLLKGL